MRLLHPGADRRLARPARKQSAPERPGDPRGARGQPVPLHGLREDHRRGADRRGGAMSVVTKPGVRDGVGADTRRPDGTLKVRGEFAYSSDLWSDRALWGT